MVSDGGQDELKQVSRSEQLEKPWFSGRDVEVLIYKVNRRPLKGDPTLFKAPDDLLAHIKKVLAMGQSGFSGRNPKRTWHIGNLTYNEETREFTGFLGWARTADALGQTWDAKSQMWESKIIEREDSAVAPLVFLEDGRLMGIMKHPSFTTEVVLDKVLTQIFNRGEQKAGLHATDWSVEPVGNENEFLSWMASLDQLTSLTITFQRPNPDGESAFKPQFERLDALRAKSITEKYVARSNTEGLDRAALARDKNAQGLIKAAMKAFGHVIAQGFKDGIRDKYNQREEVLRTTIPDVSTDWDAATDSVLNALRNLKGKKKK